MFAKPIAVAAVLASGVQPALAESATTTGSILVYLHETDGKLSEPVSAVPVDSKQFDVSISAFPVPVGVHKLALVLYDANGNEVFRVTRQQRYHSSRVGASFGYGFDDKDPSGLWWAVATLDGHALTEGQIQVLRPMPSTPPQPHD